MILALSLAAAVQTATIDWDMLAPLPYRAPPIVTPEMHAFARREAAARKCPLPGGNVLVVDVAVLVDAQSDIRAAVPRAIQCPTIEQYASGLVAGFARHNLLPRNSPGEQWYRTTITFTLAE